MALRSRDARRSQGIHSGLQLRRGQDHFGADGMGDRDAQQRVALGTLGESLGMQGVGAQAVNGIRAGIAAQRTSSASAC